MLKTTTQPLTLKGRTRRIPLAFMGEEWAEAFIEVRYLTWADTKQIRQTAVAENDEESAVSALIATIQRVFVAGRSLNAEGQMVDLSAADLENFDMDALTQLYQGTLGISDPKA